MKLHIAVLKYNLIKRNRNFFWQFICVSPKYFWYICAFKNVLLDNIIILILDIICIAYAITIVLDSTDDN